MVSNQLAYGFTTHVDKEYPGRPHDIEPVDETNASDATFNKVVSNELLNRLYNFPVASGGLSVTASGALITTHTLFSSAFSPSGDYYATTTFDPELLRTTSLRPIVQVWEAVGKNRIIPVDIKDIDASTIRITVTSASITAGNMIVTTLGETD